MDVSDDEDIRMYRGGQYIRPEEGKLTERLTDIQAFEPVYGDDFSDNIKEMSYEDFVKEREKDWGDPADAFDMNNTSTPHEDRHFASNIVAAVELATGGTQIEPSSSGGGGNDDEWWERERQSEKQNEYQPRRKGRH